MSDRLPINESVGYHYSVDYIAETHTKPLRSFSQLQLRDILFTQMDVDAASGIICHS